MAMVAMIAMVHDCNGGVRIKKDKRRTIMRSVVRAAFDIGSGATKLAVARVTVERGAPFAHVDEILFSEQRAVHLRASMLKSGADTCRGGHCAGVCKRALRVQMYG